MGWEWAGQASQLAGVCVESAFTRSSQEILKHFTIRLEEHGKRKTVRYSICTLKRAELTFL